MFHKTLYLYIFTLSLALSAAIGSLAGAFMDECLILIY